MTIITKGKTWLTLVVAMALAIPASAEDYQEKVQYDIDAFQAFFARRYPSVDFQEYANGVYAIDENARQQWLAMEDFPPYELSVDDGEALYETAFNSGQSYSECFGDGRVRQNYPYYDVARSEVVTLELAINECRVEHGEEPLRYKKGDIAKLSAYIAYVSRDEPVNVQVDSEGAYEAYRSGKEFFYSKRGQLNLSCADCHMKATGQLLRADIPSPALGQPTHFPVYRSKWGELGTLHRRYAGCNKNIRAKAFAPQSEEYRNLEYFQTVMSNGLIFNGPGSRK